MDMEHLTNWLLLLQQEVFCPPPLLIQAQENHLQFGEVSIWRCSGWRSNCMQQVHFLQPRSMPTWAVACSLHIRSLNSYLWLLLLGWGSQNSSELQYRVQSTFVCLCLAFHFGTPFLFRKKKKSECKSLTYRKAWEISRPFLLQSFTLLSTRLYWKSTIMLVCIDCFSRYFTWISFKVSNSNTRQWTCCDFFL